MAQSDNSFHVFISLVIALILMLIPMPDWTIWFRPAWLLLVLIFWTMENPYVVNIGVAWFFGLMLDVLHGTLMGEHALAVAIVIYMVAKMQARIRMFSLLQQCLIVLILVLLYQSIIYCIQGFLGDAPHGWLYWMPAVTSMILWPWVYSILRDSRHRSRAV